MSLHGKLTALVCALVLAFGLAACGGGGGGSSGTDKATQQKTAVERAIETATTRVLGLPGDAGDAEVNAAAAAVEAAKKALTDADALSPAERERFETRVSDLEDNLARTRARITAVKETRQLKTAEEARKLTKALEGTRITDIKAKVRHGTAPIMSGTVPGTPAVSVPDLKTRPNGGAETVEPWKRGLYTPVDADAGIEDTIVLYTNIERPGTKPFSGEGGKYDANNGLDADGNLPIVAEATDTAPATDTTLISAAGFPTGPGIQDHETGPGGEVLVEGTFDGAPGTFVCTPAAGDTCTSSVKHGGGYTLRGGDWKFVPTEGARVPKPDDEHQYFGWWLRNTGGDYSVGVFHRGEGGASDELANLAALQGKADYSGPAAGQFAIQREGGAAEAGAFEATATLEVDFGDDTAPGTVTGKIDDFTVDGTETEKEWSVELRSAAIGTHGTIGPGDTLWTIGDDKAETPGTWGGEFHDADAARTPTVATGVFDAVHGTIGRMTGAFGTTLQQP